jgi:hypothetical protein
MKTIGLHSSIKLSGLALLVSFALGSSPTSAATIFTTSGTIQQVSRNTAQIAFFANKPFWGPPRRGVGFKLWPADTLFVAMVSAFIPITIDGKKSGFADLKVGQAVIVEYELVVEGNMYCAATRIDAQSTLPSKNKSEHHASKR